MLISDSFKGAFEHKIRFPEAGFTIEFANKFAKYLFGWEIKFVIFKGSAQRKLSPRLLYII